MGKSPWGRRERPDELGETTAGNQRFDILSREQADNIVSTPHPRHMFLVASGFILKIPIAIKPLKACHASCVLFSLDL